MRRRIPGKSELVYSGEVRVDAPPEQEEVGPSAISISQRSRSGLPSRIIGMTATDDVRFRDSETGGETKPDHSSTAAGSAMTRHVKQVAREHAPGIISVIAMRQSPRRQAEAMKDVHQAEYCAFIPVPGPRDRPARSDGRFWQPLRTSPPGSAREGLRACVILSTQLSDHSEIGLL